MTESRASALSPTIPDALGLPGALWCWPGPGAKAAFTSEGDDQRLLMIFCDPFSVLLVAPPEPGGNAIMTRFLLDLAHEALEMAKYLDTLHQDDQRGLSKGAAKRASKRGRP